MSFCCILDRLIDRSIDCSDGEVGIAGVWVSLLFNPRGAVNKYYGSFNRWIILIQVIIYFFVCLWCARMCYLSLLKGLFRFLTNQSMLTLDWWTKDKTDLLKLTNIVSMLDSTIGHTVRWISFTVRIKYSTNYRMIRLLVQCIIQ